MHTNDQATAQHLTGDASRPWCAVKPEGFSNRVIGRYATYKSASQAARRWNANNAPRIAGVTNRPDMIVDTPRIIRRNGKQF